jgi:hypothetical protein
MLNATELHHVITTAAKHMRPLNVELTEAYPDHPDEAFAVAVCSTIAMLLGAFDNPADVVEFCNTALATFGQPWRLTSVS